MTAKSSSRELRSDVAHNHQTLIRAATAAVHRQGPRVPMATIAADAGAGIGTLYRHFATREELLSYLTRISFERVLANAQAAERAGATATEALQLFIEAAISQRNELVLPLHGGPPSMVPATRGEESHRVLPRGKGSCRHPGSGGRDPGPLTTAIT